MIAGKINPDSVLTRMSRRVSFRAFQAPGFCLVYNLNDHHWYKTHYGKLVNHWLYENADGSAPALSDLESEAERILQHEADLFAGRDQEPPDRFDYDNPDFTDLFPSY